ncbi:MAG: acyl-ACP--UDP-N-acetylglucosamine O-acyltransferase [SAR324 cluster bacterium]|uniref:Acyl-[acyl-carrier-protein]--UDP-N-acetylglucosamine O-acyltransferase n=1 Tax=SAR324 cluster bacterium TaxID=2024889 RepID=A0A7X9IJL4_9DELT|nr:acyl-ACP--UDP-N-acetylglucosamine O-acyltransferase [SAR324 cluster bacterium]
MSIQVHSTAIVENGAEIGDGTSIGPYSVIGRHVKLGANNIIGSHVVIEGNTSIGDGNKIFQFASVGSIPQDLKYHGEESRLVIGSKNLIREFVTLQPGTEGGGMITEIGNGNLFMANSHVGHDSKIGNSNIFANSVAVAGHVQIGSRAILGGLSGIHQFVRLGDLCLISAGAMVSKDVPPFCIAHGDHATLIGINKIGMERAGFDAAEIALVRKLFRMIFLSKGAFKDRINKGASIIGESKAGQSMISFMVGSSRGVCVYDARTVGG